MVSDDIHNRQTKNYAYKDGKLYNIVYEIESIYSIDSIPIQLDLLYQ